MQMQPTQPAPGGMRNVRGNGRRGARPMGQSLFFPAAAAYATIAAPLSVYAMVSGTAIAPGYASPAYHAHEMLFGFALAVVAGFLITRTTHTRLATCFGLWCGARISFVLAPGSYVSAVLNILFVLCLLVYVVPPFMKTAKKWRNKAIGPVLIVIGLTVLYFHSLAAYESRALFEGIIALTLLMLFMGGRAVAPAAAGHIRKKGGHLEARVQPRVEGALVLLLAAAAAALLWHPLWIASGVSLMSAGCVALVRLVRWRLWQCADRPDLLCLGLGYAWLVTGMELFGIALATGRPMPQTAIHAITVGALGTLTITMMARTRMIALKRPPQSLPAMRAAVALVSAAAFLRIMRPHDPDLLITASLLWSLAYGSILIALLVTRAHKTGKTAPRRPSTPASFDPEKHDD